MNEKELKKEELELEEELSDVEIESNKDFFEKKDEGVYFNDFRTFLRK